MRDVYEVLREKEAEVIRLSRQLDALRIAAPLLAEEADVKEAIQAEKSPQ